ncbi:MAG: CaiB/BaiF CoA-transferase family protein [Acidimicrobiales bacterium]
MPDAVTPPASAGALAGVRVLDFTWAVSGPTATMMLASLGAEVIKVESPRRPDVVRRNPPLMASTNRQKRTITLNLGHPAAIDLAKRLVAISDVVAESFRPKVMDGFGLGYGALREIREDIIMLSSSMAGQHGPSSHFAGYAPMFVALSGLGEMTGYEDGPPAQIRIGADIVAGVHGGFALLAALFHHQATGEGTHIDLSAIESQSCLIGDSLLEFAANGTSPRRSGNDEPGVAPHDCYRCAGDDRWVSIVVTSDEEWARFVGAMGTPAWASDAGYADSQSRWQNRHRLAHDIETWTSARTASEVTSILQAAGVAAIPSYPADELFADPHIVERDMVANIPGPARVWPVIRLGGKLARTPLLVDRACPDMGNDNAYVFQELLGLSEDELRGLAEDGAFA